MRGTLTAISPRRQAAANRSETRWLLLIHQIPPRPAYLRVKIGRHLQRIGAVAIKNSVYALPRNEETQEDFQWVLREVVKGGGDASILEARFVEGLSDQQVVALFQAARETDYRAFGEDTRQARPRSRSGDHSRQPPAPSSRSSSRACASGAAELEQSISSEHPGARSSRAWCPAWRRA